MITYDHHTHHDSDADELPRRVVGGELEQRRGQTFHHLPIQLLLGEDHGDDHQY